MEKKLTINCANCDARKVQEETLQGYESITINAAQVITDERSRALLGKYAVDMNCAEILDIPSDVQLRTVNGSAQIKSGDAPGNKCFLMVNGSLEIGTDCRKVLEQYVGIRVNGSVMYPESMSSALGMLTINGGTICYPDGAVVLKRSVVIDRLFALRAKNVLYWSRGSMVMVDPALDPAALAAKGARFSAKTAIIAESKVEALVELLDERTEIVVVPDGTAVIRDNVKLDTGVVRRYGTKLYVLGDVTVKKEGAQALEALEYLNVRGSVRVDKTLKDALLEKVEEIGGKLAILKGRYLHDMESCRITQWLLEQEPDGISVADCETVKIDENVDKGLIRERLTITDCTSVYCSAEQEDVVAAVCTDCDSIGGSEEDSADEIKDAVKKSLADGKTINAADYIL